ncbi:helix-turn-helix domain-containing protein [Yersinia enterocolitica]|uniref:helix-turn-helix domain-containing protein n=1 Tax=Yersinia enterocolitica TaxID=630 RepID=UPI00398CA0BA
MNVEIRTIPEMLIDTRGNMSALAKMLGINRATVKKYHRDKEAKYHAIVNGIFMASHGDSGKNRWHNA